MVGARLSSGQGGITEAAFQCGYNNLANFNRRFREITGLTPSEFRLQACRMQQDSGRTFVMRLGHDGAVRFTPTAMAASKRAAGRARDHLGTRAVESGFKPIEEQT
jgi:hypothetical protein